MKTRNMGASIVKLKTHEETARSGERWSPEEDSLLETRAREGLSLIDIANLHKRTPNSVKLRLCHLFNEKDLEGTTIVAIGVRDIIKFRANKLKKEQEKANKSASDHTQVKVYHTMPIGEFLQLMFTKDIVVATGFKVNNVVIDAYFPKAGIVVQLASSLTDELIKAIKDEHDCEIITYERTEEGFFKCLSAVHYKLVDNAVGKALDKMNKR